MRFAFWFGFFVGALAILGLELAVLLAVIDRLRRRSSKGSIWNDEKKVRDLDGEQSLASILNKQGIVWVLEPDKVPRLNTDESPAKGSKELKLKKNIVEVYPIKKYAKIKDQSLILLDTDGSQRTIDLLDCTVAAIAASDVSVRKWAKRYPVRLESKNTSLYNGSKTCYIYFETSWEKEAWCKALRLASCPDRAKLNWFAQLAEEFHSYLMSITAEYPSFLKPPTLFAEVPDKTDRIDVPSSRVRGFLKKLAKKASKNGVEIKSTSVSSSARGERRVGERMRVPYDASSTDDSIKSSSEKASSNSLQDLGQSGSPTTGKNLLQIVPDSVCSEKIVNDDEGTLCLNLLFSRLFFDAKRSTRLNNAIKARIQRTLSNMRTPGYIGGVTCTGLDLGDLPPLIHKMRVLPVDLNEVWAIEIDIEYSGGILLDVETRIEVCEQELQKDDFDTSIGQRSSGEVTSDCLEGIEYHGNQLVFSVNSADQMENGNEGRDIIDGLKQSKSTKWASNYASKWKAAVHSIANKVAQVPLSLAIRIASLRGTLRLQIKPPPSDQLWFGFTSMPEIEWNLDSSVGDQKISSTHVALLIGNRFKASIRETLVLPNCENICIPWMLAEKDDWLPRNVAPFIWINQEAMDMTGLDSTTSQAVVEANKALLDGSTKSRNGSVTTHEDNVEKIAKDVVNIQQQPPPQKSDTEIKTTTKPCYSGKGDELREPLLQADEQRPESPKTSSSSSENLILDQPIVMMPLEEDVKPKRFSSRKARMMDLGKKMGEKLEEKRRLIEERGRHVVEKMRENSRAQHN